MLLIELYPFGRRKFEFELVPLLDAVAALGADRPRVVCSLRDILVQRATRPAKHDERAVTRLNAAFDAIVMHADPAFATLEESFHPATPLRVPVHYTGFVAPPAPAPGRPSRLPRLVVSSGGGMVGEPLVRAAVEVHRDLFIRTGLRPRSWPGRSCPSRSGPGCATQATRSPGAGGRPRGSTTWPARSPARPLSLSQGGYNTTMDLLRAGTPAVVVPFAEGGENEQTVRDRADWPQLGVLRMVPAAVAGRPGAAAVGAGRGGRRGARAGAARSLSGARAHGRILAEPSEPAGGGPYELARPGPAGAGRGPAARCSSATTTPAGATIGCGRCSTCSTGGRCRSTSR